MTKEIADRINFLEHEIQNFKQGISFTKDRYREYAEEIIDDETPFTKRCRIQSRMNELLSDLHGYELKIEICEMEISRMRLM